MAKDVIMRETGGQGEDRCVTLAIIWRRSFLTRRGPQVRQ